jgi:RimJ/RimL family protein N-acetyltransferase
VEFVPWSDDDYPLLEQANTPEMTEYLGGPIPKAKLQGRHYRYLKWWREDTAWFYRVMLGETQEAVGTVGYWPIEWQGQRVYEVGWTIFTPFSGRGIGIQTARKIVEFVRSAPPLPAIHAFPSVHHAASNAVCRKAGFHLVGETAHEYPKGTLMRSNDWRLEL